MQNINQGCYLLILFIHVSNFLTTCLPHRGPLSSLQINKYNKTLKTKQFKIKNKKHYKFIDILILNLN